MPTTGTREACVLKESIPTQISVSAFGAFGCQQSATPSVQRSACFSPQSHHSISNLGSHRLIETFASFPFARKQQDQPDFQNPSPVTVGEGPSRATTHRDSDPWPLPDEAFILKIRKERHPSKSVSHATPGDQHEDPVSKDASNTPIEMVEHAARRGSSNSREDDRLLDNVSKHQDHRELASALGDKAKVNHISSLSNLGSKVKLVHIAPGSTSRNEVKVDHITPFTTASDVVKVTTLNTIFAFVFVGYFGVFIAWKWALPLLLCLLISMLNF
ncbi:uncharacterized protein MELLADRAFT_103467 [Melampsora larici-populina 98AG31]|uniref:Uncharacterized protein n=1 Tax=Melampsora larici-populina (strain 98AG31 / pathotype 3-4-7) TaxID=747676 RepID=F4RB43_MELLP|nr:uncharacterized protein MELLADRAFT_103467 [Melampsora larici-populina 98AG31]EGG10094.1 hypothetical protein MELLADRAFT_103467 [Melampsora larici-populina 98AG31]